MQSFRETKAYVTIYIGGSATGGTAIVGKEKAVLFLSLDRTRANCPTERKSICFDSQFLLMTL